MPRAVIGHAPPGASAVAGASSLTRASWRSPHSSTAAGDAEVDDREDQRDQDQDVAERGAAPNWKLTNDCWYDCVARVWVAFAGPPLVRPRMMSSTLSV